MLRGIERRLVFVDDRDRIGFLTRLERVLPECDVACLGFALMPNHIHLILRTGALPLSRSMARIGTGHALAFNRRHDRTGHLFQNRYKALLVEDDAYLRELVRYVHLNPVRAGSVTDPAALEEYPWTGHRALMVRGNAPFLAIDAVLSLFADEPEAARTALRAWMADPAACADGIDRSPELLTGLVLEVARACGVSVVRLRSGSKRREVSHARALAAYLACDRLGLPEADVAGSLGVGQKAIEKARTRGRQLLAEAAPGVGQVLARSFPPKGE